jgi:Tfp pilus assembly protein PilF
MQANPLSEAEAEAYLADLLLHTNRPKEAESYLQRALAHDPNLAMAHASLGMLRFRERRYAEARSALERAISANSNNYLAHYYYAYVLSKRGDDDQTLIFSYPPETAKTIQSELKKAIALKPDFPESYNLFAFVNLVMGEQLDEAVKLIEQALKLSPGKTDFSFTLAQIYMRKEDFTKAREILEPLAHGNEAPTVGQQAKGLLEGIKRREQQLSQFKAWKESSDKISATQSVQASSDPWDDLRAALRPRGAGEVQVQGVLVRIDCAPKAIVLTVKSVDRLLKIKTDTFENIDITTFTPDVAGEIQCGPHKPENVVIVCYVPSKDSSAKVDGIVKSIEFVPKDFKLTSEK